MITKDKLQRSLSATEFVKLVCAFFLFGPPAVFVFFLLMIPASPEAGFAGISLIFGWGVWFPVLLIPLVGFFVARGRAAAIRQQISELPDESDKAKLNDVA